MDRRSKRHNKEEVLWTEGPKDLLPGGPKAKIESNGEVLTLRSPKGRSDGQDLKGEDLNGQDRKTRGGPDAQISKGEVQRPRSNANGEVRKVIGEPHPRGRSRAVGSTLDRRSERLGFPRGGPNGQICQ